MSANIFFGGTKIIGLLLLLTIIQVESIDHELSCKKFSNNGVCCQGQNNNCVVSTPTKNCFCDEFCSSRSRSDCCPDYKKYCQQEKSTCIFENVTYEAGESFLKSCNNCTCHKKEGKNAELICDKNTCLSTLELLNTNESIWLPQLNYSFTEIKKLNNEFKYIGIKNPEEWLSLVDEPIMVTDYLDPPPEEYDPRFDEPSIISPIRDQGPCGASWAISVVDVISDRLSLQMNNNITLSAQQLIDCNKQQTQCTPGSPVDAWNYAKTEKLMSEECYPLTGSNDQCQLSTKQCQDDKYYLNKLYTINNVVHLSSHHVDLMYEILVKGSVQATMKIYKDLFFYDTGIYKCPKNNDNFIGYHSVRIIGWSENDDSKQYWIVANSWGTSWGDNGYFKIAKGVNECEIESYILAARIIKNPTDEIVTPIIETSEIETLTFNNDNNYCSRLFEYKNCCDGIDGNCSVPYNNKFCYCDNLCSNDQGHPFECCPDYKKHCEHNYTISSSIIIVPQNSENISPEIKLMKLEPFMTFMEFKSQKITINLPKEYKIPDNYLPPISGKWSDESWAVTATEIVSNRLSMKLDKSVVISAQQVISCSKIYRITEGQPKDAWIFMEQTEMVDDTCYPWTGNSDNCEFYIKDNYLVRCQQSSILQRPKLYQIKYAYRISNNETDIMNEIINSGSVQATMEVYLDFFNYKNGIYNKQKDAEFAGYLSVRIVGWGEESNEKFWIAANSWGTNWGENGYFKIAKGVNACLIESYVIGVEV